MKNKNSKISRVIINVFTLELTIKRGISYAINRSHKMESKRCFIQLATTLDRIR